jgi:hypothetical protein
LSAASTLPFEARDILNPSTIKSLMMKNTGSHAGILACVAKITKTEFTNTLSAIGSNSFPKSVT